MDVHLPIWLTLDRIEGEIAVLLCGNTQVFEWRLPLAWLPAGIREGERICCTFAPDPEATAAAKAHNQTLRSELARPEQRAGDLDRPSAVGEEQE